MLRPVNVMWGTDPEGFFSKDGVIVGSEKVLSKAGLKSGTAINPHVVRDGVQFEFNPPARNAIALLGKEISTAFQLLERQLRRVKNNVVLDWRGVVEVSKEELATLSDDTRILGCNPSFNVYEDWEITVDAEVYPFRSAGGHFHVGLPFKALFDKRTELIPLFDVVVGNTLTMIDRDPGAKVRRENYGRAGEYRTPPYGIEYRVPSNFWLRNYSLMSLAFGLANIAVAIFKDKLDGGKIQVEMVKVTDIKKVIQAINLSDAELARENFEKIRPILAKHLPQSGFVLTPDNLGRFDTFIDNVNRVGLEGLFPQDPLAHWVAGAQVEFGTLLNTI